MPLNGNARAQQVYNSLNLAGLQTSEQNAVLAGLQTIFGADTSYLTANAVIQPTSLQVPSGIPVSTTGSPSAQTGFTTSPEPVGGTGTLT